MGWAPVNHALNARRQALLTGARDSRGRWRCYTRVQENQSGGKLQLGRFRSWNRGVRDSLLNRSEQFDSGVPSTPTGQRQLRKWTKRRSASRAALDSRSYESGQDAGGVRGRDGIEFEGRNPGRVGLGCSVSVLLVRGRPGRSRGPGRLTPKVGASDHAGQDAKPAPHRLLLVGGVCWRSPSRRSPAIGRWVLSVGPSHPVPSASDGLLGREVPYDGPGVRRPV